MIVRPTATVLAIGLALGCTRAEIPRAETPPSEEEPKPDTEPALPAKQPTDDYVGPTPSADPARDIVGTWTTMMCRSTLHNGHRQRGCGVPVLVFEADGTYRHLGFHVPWSRQAMSAVHLTGATLPTRARAKYWVIPAKVPGDPVTVRLMPLPSSPAPLWDGCIAVARRGNFQVLTEDGTPATDDYVCVEALDKISTRAQGDVLNVQAKITEPYLNERAQRNDPMIRPQALMYFDFKVKGGSLGLDPSEAWVRLEDNGPPDPSWEVKQPPPLP